MGLPEMTDIQRYVTALETDIQRYVTPAKAGVHEARRRDAANRD